MFKRRDEAAVRFVQVGVEDGFALGADHRHGVAFLQIHFLAGVRDMVKLNELLFLGDSWAA